MRVNANSYIAVHHHIHHTRCSGENFELPEEHNHEDNTENTYEQDNVEVFEVAKFSAFMLGGCCHGFNNYVRFVGKGLYEVCHLHGCLGHNSLYLTPGLKLNLEDGTIMDIEENGVAIFVQSQITSEREYGNLFHAALSLDKFIRYANGQIGSEEFDNKMREYITSILVNLGIDTDEPFEVNGSEFNTTDHDMLEKTGVSSRDFSLSTDRFIRRAFECYALI